MDWCDEMSNDFSAMRDKGRMVIDKTDLVARMAEGCGKYAFFRPPRFGKTLLVSMLETLFRNGLRDFHGLKLEKLWQDKTYDVVRLDFSDVRRFASIEQYQRDFNAFLVRSFGRAGFSYDPTHVLPVKHQLSAWLESRPADALVLLVDDFDAPLTMALNDRAAFDGIRGILADFFALMKRRQSAFRFFFITGMTAFQLSDRFSELNDVEDLSLAPECGTLLGFTREEVEAAFEVPVKKAAEAMAVSPDEVMERLVAHCGGYCFERTASKRVLAPEAVLKFIARPAADKTVSELGGEKTAVVRRFLAAHPMESLERCAEPWAATAETLAGPASFESMSAFRLLARIGCFSIQSVTTNGVFYASCPNEEAAQWMRRLLAAEEC